MTIKAGVIGYPIEHSLSPIIHRYWLDKYNIDGQYQSYEVYPDDLEDFINGNPQNLVGFNVTIPHKEKMCKLTDILSYSAKKIGAVNTVIIKDKIFGKNTDNLGFMNNIKNSNVKYLKNKAVILGAGGAARSVIYSLMLMGFKNIYITNRTKQRAEELLNFFDDSEQIIGKETKRLSSKLHILDWDKKDFALKDTDFLVNTTSLGMVGQQDLVIDLSSLPKDAIVTDIVFNPLITGFLKQAQNRGNPIVDGLGMLLYQAVPGFKLWFDPDGKYIKTANKLPEVTEELRNKVLKVMEK